MSELAMCPLCEGRMTCVPSGNTSMSPYWTICTTCDFTWKIKPTELRAITELNSFCEAIRVGREVQSVMREGMVIDFGNHPKNFGLNDGVHGGLPHIKVYTRPIPAPLTMEGVLRECRDFVVQSIGFANASDSECIALRDKCDAVLPQDQK